MAQVCLKRTAKVEKNGSNVVVNFECTTEEQADRLTRSILGGMVRGSVRFGVIIEKEETEGSNVVRLN